MHIPAALRRLVKYCAGNRCEYCLLAQASQEAEFPIDHVVPRYDGGPTTEDDFALAGVSCSLRKQARRTSTDPMTDKQVAMFNPRRDRWHDHFRWMEIEIVGLTAIGRACISALQMNRSLILKIRREQAKRGKHPPAGSVE
jgi:hypothetical protein